MKKYALPFLAMILVWNLTPTTNAGVDIGLSISDGEVKSFYLAIGDHYDVPEKQIMVVREHKIPDDQMPVIFFLARHAHVSPRTIIKLRIKGMTWMDITFHYGLGADIYYVPVENVSGPPYGKAYGHYKHKSKKQKRAIVLSDVDVINFVNLRFISEHYGYSPEKVIKMRQDGISFKAINRKVHEIKKGKARKQSKTLASAKNDKQDHKPKGRNKGRKK